MSAPPPVKREAYERLARAASGGQMRIEITALALDQVGDACERLSSGTHSKIVLVP